MIFSLATVAAAAAANPSLPVFSFREHNPVGKYTLESLEAADCKQEADGIECDNETTVAETRAFINYLIVDQRLSRFSISGFRVAVPNVVSAFTQKYGQPCESSTVMVGNALGGRFPSQRIVWCFRTGKLVFNERFGNVDFYNATYTDNVNRPKARSVKPDF